MDGHALVVARADVVLKVGDGEWSVLREEPDDETLCLPEDIDFEDGGVVFEIGFKRSWLEVTGGRGLVFLADEDDLRDFGDHVLHFSHDGACGDESEGEGEGEEGDAGVAPVRLHGWVVDDGNGQRMKRREWREWSGVPS